MSLSSRLDGQTAFITGASSGLGARFAEVLARAGAKVAVAARRTDRLNALATHIESFDGRAVPVSCDVTDVNSIRAAFDKAETELGPISIVINNSGVSAQKKATDVTPEEYDFIFNTNTKGAFFVAQEGAKRMIQHGLQGRIVNIASVAGLRVIGQLSVYCMSKAAVVQMTKAMALEWARYGINVNAICPGYIETEINAAYWGTEGGKRLVESLPRKRVGEAKYLDSALMLLASGEESRFINGAILTVDDGTSVM